MSNNSSFIGRTKLYKNFYFQGTLSEEEIRYLDKLYEMGKVDRIKNVIAESAQLCNRDYSPNYVLYDAQTLAVALSWFNPTFFIGDKPGLGKTVMSAASFALYRKKAIESGEDYGKLLLITDNNHLIGMVNEFNKMGINLVPLYGGTKKIEKTVKSIDIESNLIDGVATSWSSVTTNGFLFYYLENKDKFTFGIFDETSCLKNDKTVLYDKVSKIAEGLDRKLFLNASPFETSIMDLFNQFKILNPKIMPAKKFIYDRYVIQGKNEWYETVIDPYVITGNYYKKVKRFAYRIVDYKNQEELKSRLKYYYIARTKNDYSKDLPDKIYQLHPVELTNSMIKELSKGYHNYDTIINSPTTLDSTKKFNFKSVPKFKVLVDLFESIAFERPVIYCFHKESQKSIKEELSRRGYRIEIINGEIDSKQKEDILKDFEEGYYDGLITNVKKAININNSDAMIFYNIPTNPQITYQLMGRIDRNNYKDKKSYHFLVYLDSPEMKNMTELALFREQHSGKFTGQEEDVYKQLIKQLENILEKGKV